MNVKILSSDEFFFGNLIEQIVPEFNIYKNNIVIAVFDSQK